MTAARWLIRNIVDDAIITASPALLAALPESNLQKQDRSLTARTTSTASQDIKLSWATDQTATMVAECFTNFTTSAQRRIICYPNADFTGTPTYDSTAVNCWAPTGMSSHFNALDPEARIRKNGEAFFTQATFKSMIVRYTDAANPDGYMEIARLFVGNYFQFQYQFPYSSGAMRPGTLTKKTRMGSGSQSASKGENFFDMPLSSGLITETDWPTVLAAADYLGIDRDSYFTLYPGDTTFKGVYHRGAFTLREPGAYEKHFYGMLQGGFMLEGQ